MADGEKNQNIGHNESKTIITEVEKRPALYDRRIRNYKNRDVKEKLWDEVCSVVFFNWDKLSKEQKLRKGNAVRRRWKNLKDCFIRELAAHRKLPPNEILERRQYVHFESLFFLVNTSNKKNLKLDQRIIDNYKKNLDRFRKQVCNRRNLSRNVNNSKKSQEDNSSRSSNDNNELNISIKNDEITNSTQMTIDVEDSSSVKYSEEIEIENLAALSDDQQPLSSLQSRVQNSTEASEERQKQPLFPRQFQNPKQIQNSTNVENPKVAQNSIPVEKPRLVKNLRVENTRKRKTSSKERELLTFLKSTEKDEKSFKMEILDLLKVKEEKKSENELFAALIVSMMDKLSNEQSHYVKMEILNVLGKAKNYQPPSHFTVINGLP